MSEYYEEEYEEEHDEDIAEESLLIAEDIFEIQEEYRRKRLIESLIGPVISTAFHLGLIIILAIFITDKYKSEPAAIEVKMEEIEEVKIEEPPLIEEPEPIEEPEEAVTPVLTTIAIEEVDTNDQALEDTNDEIPSTDDNMMENQVSDIVISPSAFASPSAIGGRGAAGRAAAVSKFGGSKAGQDALIKALWWLAKVQNPDGSWGAASQRGMTGLALLTFLAHGETHLSKNFGMNVKKAINWLVNDPADRQHGKGYGHAIKTYAIAEAFAMTGLSELESKMDECLDAMLISIKLGDTQRKLGGFNYSFGANDSRNDLSLSAWCYQAMKACNNAGSSHKKLQGAIAKAITFLKGATESKNKFAYTYKGESFNDAVKLRPGCQSMVAAGTLCLQLLGEGDDPGIVDELQEISTKIREDYEWETKQKEPLYTWYYATQAMFHAGGEMWKGWAPRFQKVLVSNQNKEGYWDMPPAIFHGKGNKVTKVRVYATCLSALQLTVFYRYLPSMTGAKGGKKMTAKEREKQNRKFEEEQKRLRQKVKEFNEEGLDLLE